MLSADYLVPQDSSPSSQVQTSWLKKIGYNAKDANMSSQGPQESQLTINSPQIQDWINKQK